MKKNEKLEEMPAYWSSAEHCLLCHTGQAAVQRKRRPQIKCICSFCSESMAYPFLNKTIICSEINVQKHTGYMCKNWVSVMLATILMKHCHSALSLPLFRSCLSFQRNICLGQGLRVAVTSFIKSAQKEEAISSPTWLCAQKFVLTNASANWRVLFKDLLIQLYKERMWIIGKSRLKWRFWQPHGDSFTSLLFMQNRFTKFLSQQRFMPNC